MAHYNESWNLPPLLGSCYMYGPQVGTSEDNLRAAVEGYLRDHPEMEEVFLEVAHALGWTS